MNDMTPCRCCGRDLLDQARFCPHCGNHVPENAPENSDPESLNLRILYLMAGLLILAVLFPPWETPPGDPPQYLGLHFILSPPIPDAIVSRMLQTIELVTIAVAGLYGSWIFRGKP